MRALILKKKRMGRQMEINLIYGGEATVEELQVLADLGFEIIVEDGKVTKCDR